MTTIGIIIGSTRPGRVGEQVARWVLDLATARDDATYEIVDLLDHPLPHLDEPLSPMLGQYRHEHTLAWARTMAAYDGLVVVTPEYNQGLPSALKNAFDYLHAEWYGKALGIVAYGVFGGAGSASQLRQICGQLGMADVQRQVALSLTADFEAYSVFRPTDAHAAAAHQVLDQVVLLSDALAPLRVSAAPGLGVA